VEYKALVEAIHEQLEKLQGPFQNGDLQNSLEDKKHPMEELLQSLLSERYAKTRKKAKDAMKEAGGGDGSSWAAALAPNLFADTVAASIAFLMF